MGRKAILPGLFAFFRRYLVAGALVFVLGLTVWEAKVNTVGPNPVFPPEAHVLDDARVQMQWEVGERTLPIVLQISENDPEFGGKLLMDKVIKGDRQNLGALKRGSTYYWRLLQGVEYSRTASFSVSADALRFR